MILCSCLGRNLISPLMGGCRSFLAHSVSFFGESRSRRYAGTKLVLFLAFGTLLHVKISYHRRTTSFFWSQVQYNDQNIDKRGLNRLG